MSQGPLLLAGSGEFTDAMRDIDRYFLRPIHNPMVAIIPTAAGQERKWWKWVDDGTRYYEKLGISSIGIPLRTPSDAKKQSVIDVLGKANAYYFSGGDPGYVLSTIQDSPAWETIYSRFREGAALAGSSAGAMLLGSWIPANIRSVFFQDGKGPGWTKALGLVPYTIWPHFDWGLKTFKDKIERSMNEAPEEVKTNWLGIDENTAVIWNGNEKPVVIGRGKAHWGKI
ncbi:MAG TPA: Type 1 glutamine amidotransferase-like domain-containing protein [Patescibacteria group bacterium]|nr:Type 1 glutamine amidotransferase-like domain-containing protein [Patescibacteria group bacterium]